MYGQQHKLKGIVISGPECLRSFRTTSLNALQIPIVKHIAGYVATMTFDLPVLKAIGDVGALS